MDEPAFTLGECRVAIIGLGLMGGSVALAIAGRCRELIGVDADPAPLAAALRRGLISRALDFDAACATADLIILATPVRAILGQLDHLKQSPARSAPAALIDLGSTKSAIVAGMETVSPGLDPIGGHPMCGKEISGLGNADPDLYRGKTFVLCPLARTSPRALSLAHELVAALGATPLVMDAETHDACAAIISHLPYTLAAGLIRTALVNDNEHLWRMAASGFRDTSRLAGSDLTMMVDILLTNRPAVLRSLAQFSNELGTLTAAIEAGDPVALRSVLESAQRKRSELFK